MWRSIVLSLAVASGDADRIRDVQQSIREAIVCETAGGDAVSDGDEEPCAIHFDESETCFVQSEAGGEVRWVCGAEDTPQQKQVG